MLALSDVIDFLLELLRDENKRAAFEDDPHGALHDAGLDGISGQDVRDAQLVMADSGAARPTSDGPSSGGGGGGGGSADAVTQITHVTRTYQAGPEVTIVQVDDRDTIINDSFNSDDDITVINAEDSFNSSVENDVTAIQDNDTIINDNDTISDDDSVVVVEDGADLPEGEPAPDAGISTSDIVGPEAEPEFSTEVEPAAVETEPIPEPEPEPEPEPDADAGADLDAAVL